jgi:gliding motility-associated lipoprotein GldH
MSTDVFEKNVAIPGQQWSGNFRPSIQFTISGKDTASIYNVYMVLRHTDAYNFNNIWIKGSVVLPGDSVGKSAKYDLTLADPEKGWLGSGMDDIYEHRVVIQERTKFNKPGTYTFTIEQIMREDPLRHVLNVGLRVEKVQEN